MLSFCTKELTGWPDHQHSEYLAAFSKGQHFKDTLPGLPDWQSCLDAVTRWTENHTLPATILWYRGCENVELGVFSRHRGRTSGSSLARAGRELGRNTLGDVPCQVPPHRHD